MFRSLILYGPTGGRNTHAQGASIVEMSQLMTKLSLSIISCRYNIACSSLSLLYSSTIFPLPLLPLSCSLPRLSLLPNTTRDLYHMPRFVYTCIARSLTKCACVLFFPSLPPLRPDLSCSIAPCQNATACFPGASSLRRGAAPGAQPSYAESIIAHN